MRTGFTWGLAALLAGCASTPHDRTPAPAEMLAREAVEIREVPAEPLTLEAVVEIALKNYPSLRAARARASAAEAGIDVANSAYLPRLDAVWEELRATRNNFAGTLVPQPTLPAISGAVSPRSDSSAWMSAAGVMLSYEPFDFGLRSATADAARSGFQQANAEADVTRLDVAVTATEAFLTLAAAQETAKAAQANVERWGVLAKAAHTLVDQQLRPGVDASRADAEFALARNQLITSEQIVETSRATLSESMGLFADDVKINSSPVLSLPADSTISPIALEGHPLIQRQAAAQAAIDARQRAIDDAYGPRLNVVAGANDRGSGFGSGDGLWPDRENWFAGVVVTFPVFDIFQLDARSNVETWNARAERARTDQIVLALRSQEKRVRSILDAARKIADNTPVAFKAAQEAQTRARARYDSGLGTLSDVADAQRLLAQAEIDDAIARLGVWRALALASRVQGDIGPFLKLVAGK